jgi:hypothetical protein
VTLFIAALVSQASFCAREDRIDCSEHCFHVARIEFVKSVRAATDAAGWRFRP